MVIRMSIRYHHTDVGKMETMLDSIKPAVQIVNLANQLVVKENVGYSGDASGGLVTAEMLQPLGLMENDLPPIMERAAKDIDNASGFLRSAA
jgi:hypothetical protein